MSAGPSRPWHVYLIECRDGSVYTGVALDVARRFAVHLAGKGAKYTRSHPPKRLLLAIELPDRSQALKAEHAIKRLPATAKRALCVAGAFFPGIHPTRDEASAAPTLPAQRSSAEYPHFNGEGPMLKIGDKAPTFSLASDSGKTISSSGLKGQRHVLYFYPKDDTPGCTREACAFRDNLPAFEKLGIPVFGLSADSEKAHAKFVGKHRLNFPLLSDPDHTLLEAYGAWVEKSMYGRKYMGIQRCTFVIGGNGRIEQVWEKVSPDSHAADVLAWLGGQLAKPRVTKKPLATKVAAGTVAKTNVQSVVKKIPAKKTAAGKAATKTATNATKPAPARRKRT